MIFIAGYFNCGTTAIAKTLMNHKDIRLFSNDSKCEEKTIHKITNSLDLNVQYSPTNKFVDGGYDFSKSLIKTDHKTANKFRDLLNEKIGDCNLIKNNKLFFAKDLLDKAFPDSKRIIIVRDGNSYAIARSHFKKLKKEIIDRAKFWNESMEYLFRSWLYDTVWDVGCYNRTFIIKYESLCSNTNKVIKNLCNFLEIDYDRLGKIPEFKSRNYKWNNIDKELQKAIKNETKMMEVYKKWIC